MMISYIEILPHFPHSCQKNCIFSLLGKIKSFYPQLKNYVWFSLFWLSQSFHEYWNICSSQYYTYRSHHELRQRHPYRYGNQEAPMNRAKKGNLLVSHGCDYSSYHLFSWSCFPYEDSWTRIPRSNTSPLCRMEILQRDSSSWTSRRRKRMRKWILRSSQDDHHRWCCYVSR